MGRTYSEPTLKILFGRATRCAYPGCREALIFEDRGRLTVVAQIAHIRSASPDGPRHVPGYQLVNDEENLLLLCGTHHKPVDDHESVYLIDELLDWKRRQVTEGAGQQLSNEQLGEVVQQVERSLAKLAEVKLAVRPVGVFLTGTRQISIPLAGFATAQINMEHDRCLGVDVVNEGLVAVTVEAVGISLDVQDPAHPGYLFPLDDPPYGPPRRIEGKSSATWIAHTQAVAAGVQHLAREYLRLPGQFRPYVLHGAGHRVNGEWASATQLPIWNSDMTEERLQNMITASAEARRRAGHTGTP